MDIDKIKDELNELESEKGNNALLALGFVIGFVAAVPLTLMFVARFIG